LAENTICLFAGNRGPGLDFKQETIAMYRPHFVRVLLIVLVLSISAVGQTNNKTFNAFWKSFKTAIAKNDKQAVADMTKLPFMIEGVNEDRAGFLKHYNSLFTRKMKRCIATAKPLKEQEYYEIFCGEQIFLFSKDADGKYKFSEIGAND
jgi:hypothetical protein